MVRPSWCSLYPGAAVLGELGRKEPGGRGRVWGKHQSNGSYPCRLNPKSPAPLGPGFAPPDLRRVVEPRRRTRRQHENQKRRFEVRRLAATGELPRRLLEEERLACRLSL